MFDQAPAEEEEDPHITHTYMQDALKAAERPVHPLTPIPHQTQIIPPSQIPLTRAAESAAPAVSEPLTLAGNTLKHFDAQRVCTHTSTPEADFSSANASVGKGPQEKLVRDSFRFCFCKNNKRTIDSEIRTGGGADGGGGAELNAAQGDPHEEETVFDQPRRKKRTIQPPRNGSRRGSTRRTRRRTPPWQAGRRGAT